MEDDMKSTQRLYSQLAATLTYEDVYWLLQLILTELGFDWQARREIPDRLLEILRAEPDEPRAVQKVWQLLGAQAVVVDKKLATRASQIVSQVAHHVRGNHVLDFGCGDARVATRLSGLGHEMTLYDVDDYRASEARYLPFHTEWSGAGGGYDTTLAVTVFHHCDEPALEIARLAKVTHRLIIIESVIDRLMPFQSQAFVDWLYNRGMHPDAHIPVPGKFKSIEDWRELLQQHGFMVVSEEDLGIDIAVVPEHHYLFVAERA